MNTFPAFMNLGPQELILIIILVLVLFGAKKIPELARGLGQGMKEFKRAKDDFDREIHKTADELDVTKEDAAVPKPAASKPASSKPKENQAHKS